MVWFPTHHWRCGSCLLFCVYLCILSTYIYIYTYNFCHLINPSCPEESLNMTPAKTDFGSFGFPVKEWKESWKNHPKLDLMHMGVSKNRVVPQIHPFLIGFSIINHPFWGSNPLYFWKHPYNERNFHQMVGRSISDP